MPPPRACGQKRTRRPPMGSSRGHIPIRTCVACGAKGDKHRLVRFVLEGDRLVKDPLGRRPGRGAYICPTEACSERLSKERGFRKKFLRTRKQ